MNHNSRSRYSIGLPPSELWGVAKEDRKPVDKTGARRRTEAACARRRDRRVAKVQGVTLNSYLRSKHAS